MKARNVDRRMRSGRLPLFTPPALPDKGAPAQGFAGVIERAVNWLEGAKAWPPAKRTR